jgi:hypothetical protein
MTTIYDCYFAETSDYSGTKCDGCGDLHKDCEKWDALVKREEKERIEGQEAERKRMLCGKCDKCKVVGVKLNPVWGHYWDLCDGCFKTYYSNSNSNSNSKKKSTKKN